MIRMDQGEYSYGQHMGFCGEKTRNTSRKTGHDFPLVLPFQHSLQRDVVPAV